MITTSFLGFIVLRVCVFMLILFVFAILSKRIGAVVIEDVQPSTTLNRYIRWLKRLRP